MQPDRKPTDGQEGNMKGRSQIRGDILSVQVVRKIIDGPAFPVLLQMVLLGTLIVLMVNGWGIGLTESAQELKTLRKTNLTTLLVWGLWWPGMIALVLMMGKVWCTVCPMELVNRIGDAIAGRIRLPRIRMAGWMKAGWLVVLLYLTLQLAVAGFSLHRVPHYTSVMLGVLLGLAFLSGLLFRGSRSFCVGGCPARALLSVYGRYTPLQLDVRDREVCAQCRTKDCVAEENRHRFDKRSCPSRLKPFERDPSDGCVLCFQCAKVCPYENLGFGFVSGRADSRRKRLLEPYETVFILLAAGFVAHEVAGEVRWFDEIFHTIPTALNRLAPSVDFGWFEALWFLFLFPVLLWSVATGLAWLCGQRPGWRVLLVVAATGAAPLVAVSHMAKSLAKMSSWGGYLPLAAADPNGLEAFHRISEGGLDAPARLLDLSVIGWALLVVLAVLFWRSWVWPRAYAGEASVAARTALVVVMAFFAGVLLLWSCC